jgi:hypothetical protein
MLTVTASMRSSRPLLSFSGEGFTHEVEFVCAQTHTQADAFDALLTFASRVARSLMPNAELLVGTGFGACATVLSAS